MLHKEMGFSIPSTVITCLKMKSFRLRLVICYAML